MTDKIRNFLLLAAMLLAGTLIAQGQAVIMNGNYYLTHNEAGTTVNSAATTTFNPATCLWYVNNRYIQTADNNGDAFDGNTYLQRNTLSIGEASRWTQASNNNAVYYSTGGWGATYYYLRLNGTTWQINSTNNTNGTVYDVDITSNTATSTNPTISGADVITATGNTTYTASGAVYRAAYTNYAFRSANHYIDANGNIFTGAPAAATITYSWNLESNAYATVNNSGVVTVSSLPESDVTLTLTVTAIATGGTPAAPANTTFTATKEITIQGTKPSAPIITVNGNTATLSTEAAGTTTIRYTLDGSDPTPSTGTVYSGTPIDISSSATSPVTIKAITVRDGHASSVTEQKVTLTLPAPTITADASAGTATISSSVASATIYYTTDGTTPTASSTQYTDPLSDLSVMTTIKAIAVKSGWNDSPEASAILTIPSGSDGTTVTIFDLEDHNWSYYQAAGDLPTGYPTDYLSSPDPRNVKITYRGGSVSGASAVAISALDGEGENEMIYYKTLEKSVPGMTGNYPYTVISNPFSKRPKNGNTYYGFAGWKVVSGGEYIAEYNDNGVLELDETIHFTNLDNNYTANCTSGEVVFEATWTAATVQTGNSAPTFSGGTYETNFWVLSGNNNIGNITVPANVTVSARNPDGTVNFTRNLTGTITAGGNNAKVEFVNMNSTGAVTAANYTFTMGRGIVNTGNGGDLSGESRNANCNQTVKIESGKYASLHNFITGLNAARTCDQLMILGCDYDRAKGDNSKLEITTTMYVADRQTLNRTSGSLYVRTYIKSGSFLTGQPVSDASAAYTYYFSVANTQNKGRRHLEIEGGILKSVAGGIDDGNNANDLAFTFRMRGGKLLGSIYGAAAFAETDGIRRMIFTGGEVNGWIAGGANGVNTTSALNANSGVLPADTYIYIGGKTKVESTSNTNINSSPGGYVFGAGVGRQALVNAGNAGGNTGRVNTSYVSVSDQCEIEHDVFAGGNFGYNNVGGNVFVTGGTVHGSVFGGANQNRGVNSNITMTGGLVESGIYGGSNVTGSLSGNVTMHIDGGQVGTSSQSANIHGGGYGSVTRVLGTVDLTLGSGCDATNGVTVYGDVYGGSAEGRTNGDNYRNGNATTTVNMYKGTINGSLYGGGLGTASNAAHVYGPVQVNVIGGSIRPTDGTGENGSGGVYGCNNANGAPQSTVKVDIYGTDEPASGYALYAVYGGGNQSDYDGIPDVTIHGCSNSIEYVYGGGNASDVAGTNVVIWGGTIGNAFGGGNGFGDSNPGANITDDGTQLYIHGGNILYTYGGSNQKGYINSTITVEVDNVPESGNDPFCNKAYGTCPTTIEELYGGGNEATATTSSSQFIQPDVQIKSCDVRIANLYGGARKANHNTDINLTVEGGIFQNVFGGNNISGIIGGDINLTLKGGTMVNAFGGNNAGGDVSGKISVIVEADGGCPLNVDNVYGGGNMAPYTPTTTTLRPEVTIKNGTVNNAVFGGGLGSGAEVTANPLVIVGDNTTGYKAIVGGTKIDGTPGDGHVFGGGNAATVNGNTEVRILYKSQVLGNVYGGGNQGEVGGNTKVVVNGD